MVCSLVIAPRPRYVAFLGFQSMVLGAEDGLNHPQPTDSNRPRKRGRVG